MDRIELEAREESTRSIRCGEQPDWVGNELEWAREREPGDRPMLLGSSLHQWKVIGNGSRFHLRGPLLSILRAYPPDRRHRMELKMWAKNRRAVERSRIPYVMNSVLPVGHERR